MASGGGMSNVAKIGVLVVIAGLGFAGWKWYSSKLQSKDDGQIFQMIADGGAMSSAAEGELMVRTRSGKIPVETLRAHLKDTAPKSRIAAIGGLAAKKDKESAGALIGTIEDVKEDAEVKEAACKAFVDIRVKEAVPALLGALDMKSEAIRQQASMALRSITGQSYSNKEVDKWKLWWGENSKTFTVKD